MRDDVVLGATLSTAAIDNCAFIPNATGGLQLHGGEVTNSAFVKNGFGGMPLNPQDGKVTVLDGGIIAPGDVWTATASCEGVIVVVAEDVGGCFLSHSVACGADATWTITGTTPRDCGR